MIMNPSAKVLILISFFYLSFTSYLNQVDAGCGPCGPCAPCGPQPADPCATKAYVQLTDANFDQQVVKSCDVWMVMFTTSWCGYGKRLEPEWNQAAKNMGGKVKFGYVNCETEKATCSKYKISYFPTVLIFPANDKQNPTESWDRIASDIEIGAQEALNCPK